MSTTTGVGFDAESIQRYRLDPKDLEREDLIDIIDWLLTTLFIDHLPWEMHMPQINKTFENIVLEVLGDEESRPLLEMRGSSEYAPSRTDPAFKLVKLAPPKIAKRIEVILWYLEQERAAWDESTIRRLRLNHHPTYPHPQQPYGDDVLGWTHGMYG